MDEGAADRHGERRGHGHERQSAERRQREARFPGRPLARSDFQHALAQPRRCDRARSA
jgi:hypothetical protein